VKAKTNNAVVVSDTHCGCELGLCPPQGAARSGGGRYTPSKFQRWLWRLWRDEFWGKFVPIATAGEPYVVVFNGDAIDGRHHNATTLITGNIAEQSRIFIDCMKAVLTSKCTAVYMTAGTEVHTGLNDEWVEPLARELGVVPDKTGRFIRPELYLRLGTKGRHQSLVHVAHHIGSSGVTAYETTAPHRELVEAMQNAARWREEVPTVICRSHRHIPVETRMMTANGYATAVVTGCWQGKTPFVYRLMSGRVAPPQFGGLVIRSGDIDTFTRSAVWSLKRSRAE